MRRSGCVHWTLKRATHQPASPSSSDGELGVHLRQIMIHVLLSLVHHGCGACRLLQELASLDRNAEDARLEECLEAVELDYLLARYLQVADATGVAVSITISYRGRPAALQAVLATNIPRAQL